MEEVLKTIPVLFIMFAIAGITAGATVLTQVQFGDTMDKCINSSYVYNSSRGGSVCHDSTGVMTDSVGYESLNLSNEYYVNLQGIEGSGEMAAQLPTVAIISIMVVIISVLVGAFAVTKMFGA